jgi:hypothetical protein
LLVLALVLVLAGPLVVLLGGGFTAGGLLFASGVVVLGVHGLVEGRDRAVGWVLIFTGVLVAVGDVIRALLI